MVFFYYILCSNVIKFSPFFWSLHTPFVDFWCPKVDCGLVCTVSSLSHFLYDINNICFKLRSFTCRLSTSRSCWKFLRLTLQSVLNFSCNPYNSFGSYSMVPIVALIVCQFLNHSFCVTGLSRGASRCWFFGHYIGETTVQAIVKNVFAPSSNP